jgi:two-component system NtrC family sensor kinase
MLAAAALLLPLLLFLFASWVSYRATQELAYERLTRSLEVMEEEALKAFQSMTLALDTIDQMLANRSAADIKSDEARLRQRLLQIEHALPEVQSIWIFGSDGHPQIMTREYPALTSLNYSDQDYFLVPRDGPPGIYVGGIHQSVSGGQPYFTFNRARHDAEGKFAGVIEMSLLPSDFTKFYSELASSRGLRFAMLREDGTVLARYPLLVDDRRLEGRSGFLRAVASSPTSAFYTTTAVTDGIERLVGIRRVQGVPVYVSGGIATAEIRNEWMSAMALHLIFGLPATALLFGAVMIVLHRTRRLHAEQDRREAVELAMRHSQRMDAIGRLTGGVAHDFNNLLTIIIGNLETALRQLESSTDGAQERLSRRLGAAMQGAQRAATMTKRLLAFSRQQPLKPTPLDINRVLNGLSDFLRRALGEEISLEIVGSGGLWPIEADATELETALLNLAINARDAMEGGGKLTIEASNTYLDDAYCRNDPDLQPGNMCRSR